MATHDENPLEASPGTGDAPAVSHARPLASRLARLGATLVDAFIGIAISLPIGIMTGYFGRVMEQKATLMETALYSVGGMVVFLLLHGYLLATQGQTIGKKLVGVRIVDYNTGTLLAIAKLIGLRVAPIWIVSMIPLAGGCLALIDILFIFGNEQRCIHDLIAGTKVVEA
jgi:uncharacterized RDD family membrane protein YckC